MSTFNINKYIGKWYEIAKIPFKWEQNCYNVTAEYSLINDKFVVSNSCDILSNGMITTIQRKATGYSTDNPMIFNIIFDDGLPNDGFGEYRILYTNYIYSIVGSSDKSKLWILARNRIISEYEYKSLINIAKNFGYDVNKLIISRII